MKNNLSNNTDNLIEKNKKIIDWTAVQSEMKNKFGKDIFESWLKKINFVDEFKSYILISVPTRFIRDWITSRYLDQILQIVKTYNKEIIRIEFVIDENKKELNSIIQRHGNNLNNVFQNNISFIKDTTL